MLDKIKLNQEKHNKKKIIEILIFIQKNILLYYVIYFN